MLSIRTFFQRSITLALSAALTLPTLPMTVRAQPVGLPSMGATSSVDLSPALERKLGEAIMAEGRRDPTYVHDAELSQYLTTMGRKLAVFSPGTVPEVEMFGVRDPEINAFAMPGGFIGVNTGLIVATTSESELAAVLAHEIGHVVQRHIARGMTQQKQNSMVMMAAMAGALLAALAGGGGDLAIGMATFGQAAAVNRQLGFSRDAEREADRAGFQMLTKAGYDPRGMEDMFARLMNASRLNEGLGGGAWASTHPLSIERLSDIQNRVRTQAASTHADSDDYWYIRAKMRVVQGNDAVRLRSTTQQLKEEAQNFSGVRRSAAYYGLSLDAFLHNNWAEAERYWNLASADGKGSPALAKLSIEIALARNDHARALQLAQAATKRWSTYRALGMVYAQALQKNGRQAEAQDYLRAKIKQWGDDEPQLYEMLAQSEAQTGQAVKARLSMARYYVAIGAFSAAASQLQQARDLATDFYEQSQIDVRIREVRDKLTEERQLLEQFKSG